MPKEIESPVLDDEEAEESDDIAEDDLADDADLEDLAEDDDLLDEDDDTAADDDLDEVDIADDADDDLEEGAVVTERPAAEGDEAAGEEDDDEEIDDDDVEASLDVILKERLVVEEDEDEDEDEPADAEDRTDGNLRVLPKQPGEFVCQSCFLVKSESQLADRKRKLCRDCV
jgi:hypothetical protein